MNTTTKMLCESLYGRKPEPHDYGSNAQFHARRDAARVIDGLTRELNIRDLDIRDLDMAQVGVHIREAKKGLEEFKEWGEHAQQLLVQAAVDLMEASVLLEAAATEVEGQDREITIMKSQLRLNNIMMDSAGQNIKEKDREILFLSNQAIVDRIRMDAYRQDTKETEGEIDKLEDRVDTNDRLISMAAERIESDGRYIEKLEADIKRLEYYETVLCLPHGKLVMTVNGACQEPIIEKIFEVIEERDALRKELAAVKADRDEAQEALIGIAKLVR